MICHNYKKAINGFVLGVFPVNFVKGNQEPRVKKKMQSVNISLYPIPICPGYWFLASSVMRKNNKSESVLFNN